jgi:hypothetical protein
MKTSAKIVSILGILIFIIGVVMGMFFYVSAAWADIESVFYGFARYSNRPMTAMKCPVFITDAETGVVQAVIDNTVDTQIRPTIRFEVSNRGLMVPQTERITLQAGETQRLSYDLSPDNQVMGNFVFAKLVFYSAYPLPDREQTCGIRVLELGHFTGLEVSIFLTVGSVIFMLIGILLWAITHKSPHGHSLDLLRSMSVLTIVVAVGIVSGLVASWVLGLVSTTVAVLLVGAVVGNILQSSK